MLTSADLKKLLAAGPSARIEVLSPNIAAPERMARSLVALANTRGGVLVISFGAKDKVSPDETRDRALQAMLMSEPRLIAPLPYFVGDDPSAPEALIVEVPEGLPNVYSLDGRYLTRENGRNVVLGARALRELMLVRSEGTWESAVPSGASRDDLDWSKVEAYAQQVTIGTENVEDVLLRRGCLIKRSRQIKPTYAGLLLFGRQPQRWVRGAEILCARFGGFEMDDVFARQTIGGTLPEQIRRAEAFLAENMPHRARLRAWQRSDEPLYPPGVLREAVVNAVAHRDYRLTGNQIHVLMFSDRVEVRSPGRLPGHITLKNLLRERYSRNEAIVQVLADMGFIERLGYGIDRMVRAMKEADQPPPAFEETDAGFAVTLYAKSAAPSALPAPQTAQQQRWQKMLAYLKANGRITNRDYQELCPDVNPETLRRDFVDMVERGLILRIGDKRGTYYILK
ncbi:MAG: transcriptional regulator [Candidatus Roseilinea sp.]|nr:MAG: transcriptional regulator [Candidatus Roseilinea sp.]